MLLRNYNQKGKIERFGRYPIKFFKLYDGVPTHRINTAHIAIPQARDTQH